MLEQSTQTVPTHPVFGAFLEGPRIFMRPLRVEDATEEYLSWLNDPTVLRYRGSKAYPQTMENLRSYLDLARNRGDLMLGIFLKEGRRHIGNIALQSILWVHRSAELALMIGSRDVWGQHFGREAIYVLSRHAFLSMGLHRLTAISPNPAFNSAVKALGWKHEGTRRQAFWLDGQYVDFECYGLLDNELKDLPDDPRHG